MARYGELVDVVERLKQSLKTPGANPAIIQAILVLTEGGKVLGAKNAKKVFIELFPDIAPILQSDKDLRTTMEVLQKVYDTEVDKPMKFLDELDWFMRSQSKLVAEVRAMLTGVDLEELRFFLQVTGERALSANNIIRAPDFPKLKLAFEKIVTVKDPRLARLMREFADKEVIETLRKTGFITDFHFWRVKGAVMEILATPIKEAYRRVHYPNAVLIEGVMAMTKLTREGLVTATEAPRQIWDGIIAEVTSTGLKILLKFEVKSGMQGFQQGFEQILSTHYNRFTSFGDELHVVIGGKKRVFKLSKNANAPDSIQSVASENVLITPEGQSFVMPNQRLQTGGVEMITQLLELGDREITHLDVEALVMDFLLGLK